MVSTDKIKVVVLKESTGEEFSRSISKSDDGSLLEFLIKQGIEIDHSCGGNGICGTCQYTLISEESSIEPRNEIEAELATDRGFSKNERLACQTHVRASLKIRIP